MVQLILAMWFLSWILFFLKRFLSWILNYKVKQNRRNKAENKRFRWLHFIEWIMFHKTTFLCIPIDSFSFSFSFFQEPIDSIYRTQNDIWQCWLRVMMWFLKSSLSVWLNKWKFDQIVILKPTLLFDGYLMDIWLTFRITHW